MILKDKFLNNELKEEHMKDFYLNKKDILENKY